MRLGPEWKWKVSWREQTKAPPKRGEAEGKLIATDDYGVWFRTKAEANECAMDVVDEGWKPSVTAVARI